MAFGTEVLAGDGTVCGTVDLGAPLVGIVSTDGVRRARPEDVPHLPAAIPLSRPEPGCRRSGAHRESQAQRRRRSGLAAVGFQHHPRARREQVVRGQRLQRRLRSAQGVRRIGKDQIESLAAKLPERFRHFGPYHPGAVAVLQGRKIVEDHAAGPRVVLDQHGARGAAGEGLERQRARPRVQVEDGEPSILCPSASNRLWRTRSAVGRVPAPGTARSGRRARRRRRSSIVSLVQRRDRRDQPRRGAARTGPAEQFQRFETAERLEPLLRVGAEDRAAGAGGGPRTDRLSRPSRLPRLAARPRSPGRQPFAAPEKRSGRNQLAHGRRGSSSATDSVAVDSAVSPARPRGSRHRPPSGDPHRAGRSAARAQLPGQLRRRPRSAERHDLQSQLHLAHRAGGQRRVARVSWVSAPRATHP